MDHGIHTLAGRGKSSRLFEISNHFSKSTGGFPMLENVIIVVVVAVVIAGAGVAWWFENGPAGHTDDPAADADKDGLTKTEK